MSKNGAAGQMTGGPSFYWGYTRSMSELMPDT